MNIRCRTKLHGLAENMNGEFPSSQRWFILSSSCFFSKKWRTRIKRFQEISAEQDFQKSLAQLHEATVSCIAVSDKPAADNLGVLADDAAEAGGTGRGRFSTLLGDKESARGIPGSCRTHRHTEACRSCRSSRQFLFRGFGLQVWARGRNPRRGRVLSSQLTRGFPACHRVSNETDTGGAAAQDAKRTFQLAACTRRTRPPAAAQEINRHKHEVELHHWEVPGQLSYELTKHDAA